MAVYWSDMARDKGHDADAQDMKDEAAVLDATISHVSEKTKVCVKFKDNPHGKENRVIGKMQARGYEVATIDLERNVVRFEKRGDN